MRREISFFFSALQMCLGWPLPVCYVVSSLVIIPLVTHGITLISRLRY